MVTNHHTPQEYSIDYNNYPSNCLFFNVMTSILVIIRSGWCVICVVSMAREVIFPLYSLLDASCSSCIYIHIKLIPVLLSRSLSITAQKYRTIASLLQHRTHDSESCLIKNRYRLFEEERSVSRSMYWNLRLSVSLKPRMS